MTIARIEPTPGDPCWLRVSDENGQTLGELNASAWIGPDADFAAALAREIAALVEERDRLREALAERDISDFNGADWFWRTMDPDDCGDAPEEAINRGMVGRLCVCEIACSFSGPTRYGFIAPSPDPDSDDEVFVHFATKEQAIEAVLDLRAALPSQENPR